MALQDIAAGRGFSVIELSGQRSSCIDPETRRDDRDRSDRALGNQAKLIEDEPGHLITLLHVKLVGEEHEIRVINYVPLHAIAQQLLELLQAFGKPERESK